MKMLNNNEEELHDSHVCTFHNKFLDSKPTYSSSYSVFFVRKKIIDVTNVKNELLNSWLRLFKL